MNSSPPRIPTTLEMHRYYHELANDADWAGDHDLANSLRRISTNFLDRHLSGDLHEPPF